MSEIADRAVNRRICLPGHFSSPVFVEAVVEQNGLFFLRVRNQEGRLEEVTLDSKELQAVLDTMPPKQAAGVPPEELFLLIESARIRLAFALDPYFAVSLCGVEALPHQLEAVYERILSQARLSFLLVDDPGAGKTIMAGLLMKELKMRGTIERTLVVTPAALTIQWQDELRSKFEEPFEIIGAELAKNQLAGNVWERFPQCITSLDFAKQDDVWPDILRVNWDLIVIDEAHKCSARTYGREVKKTLRYQLGERLTGQADRLLLLTATPHQGTEDQYVHFLRLIDPDQFIGAPSDRSLIMLDESPWSAAGATVCIVCVTRKWRPSVIIASARLFVTTIRNGLEGFVGSIRDGLQTVPRRADLQNALQQADRVCLASGETASPSSGKAGRLDASGADSD